MKKKRYSSTAVEFPSTLDEKSDRQSIFKRFIHAHAPTRAIVKLINYDTRTTKESR